MRRTIDSCYFSIGDLFLHNLLNEGTYGSWPNRTAITPVFIEEVKLEILGDGKKVVENDYPALTKSELMEYAKDPFWVGLRWGLFIFFWLIWLTMLVASIVIIVMAP